MATPMTVGVADAYAFALAAFRETLSTNDPAAVFAGGMRHVCQGFECGVLPGELRAPLAVLMLAAEQAIERAAVPACLEAGTFEGIAARMPDLLQLWTVPLADRETWHPDYAPGFRAMIRMLANEVENVSLTDTACRGLPHFRLAVDSARDNGAATFEDRTHADVSRQGPSTWH